MFTILEGNGKGYRTFQNRQEGAGYKTFERPKATHESGFWPFHSDCKVGSSLVVIKVFVFGGDAFIGWV